MTRLKSVAFGMLGVFLALVLWRAYLDYTDFCTMRNWIKAVQADIVKQQRAAQVPKPTQ